MLIIGRIPDLSLPVESVNRFVTHAAQQAGELKPTRRGSPGTKAGVTCHPASLPAKIAAFASTTLMVLPRCLRHL